MRESIADFLRSIATELTPSQAYIVDSAAFAVDVRIQAMHEEIDKEVEVDHVGDTVVNGEVDWPEVVRVLRDLSDQLDWVARPEWESLIDAIQDGGSWRSETEVAQLLEDIEENPNRGEQVSCSSGDYDDDDLCFAPPPEHGEEPQSNLHLPKGWRSVHGTYGVVLQRMDAFDTVVAQLFPLNPQGTSWRAELRHRIRGRGYTWKKMPGFKGLDAARAFELVEEQLRGGLH